MSNGKKISSIIKMGPCKMDLMLALFDSPVFPANRRRSVEFTIANGEKIEVFVSSVQQEDGSGESWNIEGFHGKSFKKISGYYSTQRRSGTLTIE